MSPAEIKAAWLSWTVVVFSPYKHDTLNQRRLNVVAQSAMLVEQ